jgi:hypothetical protein
LYTIYVYGNDAVEIRPVYSARSAPDLRPTRRQRCRRDLARKPTPLIDENTHSKNTQLAKNEQITAIGHPNGIIIK